MSFTLDITDPNIKNKLAVLPEKMADYAEEVLLAQAQLISGLAKIYCPVDTGSLRDSIRVERGGRGLHWREVKVRAGGYIVNPGTGELVDYAVYVHEGTKYMSARPFLVQAVEEVKPTITDMINANVVQKIDE